MRSPRGDERHISTALSIRLVKHSLICFVLLGGFLRLFVEGRACMQAVVGHILHHYAARRESGRAVRPSRCYIRLQGRLERLVLLGMSLRSWKLRTTPALYSETVKPSYNSSIVVLFTSPRHCCLVGSGLSFPYQESCLHSLAVSLFSSDALRMTLQECQGVEQLSPRSEGLFPCLGSRQGASSGMDLSRWSTPSTSATECSNALLDICRTL